MSRVKVYQEVYGDFSKYDRSLVATISHMGKEYEKKEYEKDSVLSNSFTMAAPVQKKIPWVLNKIWPF